MKKILLGLVVGIISQTSFAVIPGVIHVRGGGDFYRLPKEGNALVRLGGGGYLALESPNPSNYRLNASELPFFLNFSLSGELVSTPGPDHRSASFHTKIENFSSSRFSLDAELIELHSEAKCKNGKPEVTSVLTPGEIYTTPENRETITGEANQEIEIESGKAKFNVMKKKEKSPGVFEVLITALEVYDSNNELKASVGNQFYLMKCK